MVKAQKLLSAYEDCPTADCSNSGALRAYKMVAITDIFGNQRMRRVSLGNIFSVGLETAKDMVYKARAADTEPGSVCATFTIGL